MAYKKPYSYYSTGTYSDPSQRLVHVAAPEHGDLDTPDAVPIWYAPALTPVADIGAYPGMNWVMTGGSMQLDHTPVSHDGGDTMPMQPDLRAMAAASGARHGTDYGSSLAGNWAPPPVTFRDEHQVYTRIPGNGPGDDISVSTVALQRGLNSLPENNPDGYNPGSVQWERAERKFAIGERVHDMRVLHLNVAEGGGTNVPAKGGPYNSPFDSLARALTNINARPQQRREPQGIGESELSDGALDSYFLAPRATVGQWVVG